MLKLQTLARPFFIAYQRDFFSGNSSILKTAQDWHKPSSNLEAKYLELRAFPCKILDIQQNSQLNVKS